MAGGIIFLETIEDALHQRIFRTYDNHADILFKSESLECGKVCRFDIHIFAYSVRTGIAGSDVQLFNFRALSNFPCQSVFAAA